MLDFSFLSRQNTKVIEVYKIHFWWIFKLHLLFQGLLRTNTLSTIGDLTDSLVIVSRETNKTGRENF